MRDVTQLIETVLRAIQVQFYGRDRLREFMRDRPALIKAVARYGFECDHRGWAFEADAIQRDLLELLRSMLDKRAEIGYMPIYLEGAVDRHIRIRAEELREAALQADGLVKRTMAGVRVEAAAPQMNATTALATLYRDLRAGRKRKQAPTKVQDQLGLF